jgi:hypothetical protein
MQAANLYAASALFPWFDDCPVVVVVGEFEPPQPATASAATAAGSAIARVNLIGREC